MGYKLITANRFGGPWLARAGFSAADAFYAPLLYRFRSYGLHAEEPAKSWMQPMLEYRAMIAWERQALAETSHEQSHADEGMAIAHITDDYRVQA